jgi:protein-L-isoaspartate(D-aspartate) O-methyltransferase
MRLMGILLLWLLVLTLAFVGCAARNGEPRAGTSNDQWDSLRQRMVKWQLAAPGRNITNQRVLAAMSEVPRHEFVPLSQQSRAYEDFPLPIGFGQTISQPYIVAFMTAQLDPQPGERILEIGSGSGYQAAVLSKLGAEVFSIEIIQALANQAETNLNRLHFEQVKIKSGDGYLGWPEYAPFDAIIVTCAPTRVPEPLVNQLKPHGRMIIPVGEPGDQMLYLLRKNGDRLEQQAVLPVRFVPMTGGAQSPRNP